MTDGFEKLLKLEGLDFIRALLLWEERRFSADQFFKGSTYEEICADYGNFPPTPAYPLYFAGDITKPEGKKIFVGINPGYSEEGNRIENEFLKSRGLFEGYCTLFKDFRYQRKSGLLPYFANIVGFLRRYYGLTGEINNWNWLQENIINLDFVPYHSKDSAGIKINNKQKFRETQFEIFLKIIRYLNPSEPIFLNGFNTFAEYLGGAEFRDVIHFSKYKNIWIGKIDSRYNFVGLPFLNRPKGGVDQIVANVKEGLGDSSVS